MKGSLCSLKLSKINFFFVIEIFFSDQNLLLETLIKTKNFNSKKTLSQIYKLGLIMYSNYKKLSGS
ncbi:hypothetical protein BpHYR1_016305 [Brachionus plicatilis]|uniref:Uncharacterized protein n=1 Tax=Brachionus plicatilis TaxID=10195 RepID=A0A3M7PJI8_BRAPC|nr:hypothetical protein BpHYR1_016305 [Brachionus plicatilis]